MLLALEICTIVDRVTQLGALYLHLLFSLCYDKFPATLD